MSTFFKFGSDELYHSKIDVGLTIWRGYFVPMQSS